MTLLNVLDVSNYNDLVSDLARFPNTDAVNVRLPQSVESMALRQIARSQIELLFDRHLKIGGYIWGYPDVDPIKTVHDAVEFCASVNLVLPILWLDLETYANQHGPQVDWIRSFTTHCQALGIPVGLYTGAWWVEGHLTGSWDALERFNDLPVWVAQYSGGPSLDTVFPVWANHGFKVWGKQWTDRPVDQNVFLPEAFGVEVPAPGPTGDLTGWINAVAYLGDDIGDTVSEAATTLSRLNAPLQSTPLSDMTVKLANAALELQRVRREMVGPRP